MSRKRGRPRKYPMMQAAPQSIAEPAFQPEPPAEIDVRLGFRPVATSKGRSDGSNRFVVPGSVVTLPRHEAENLVSMGYASHV